MAERVATLERRLHEGYDRIEAEKRSGGDKEEVWEEFWLSLLKEYEQLHDQLWGKK